MQSGHVSITRAPALLDSTLATAPPGFAPLWYRRHVIGAISPAWMQWLDPDVFELEVHESRHQVHLVPEDRRATGTPSGESLDLRLQRWARYLRDEGALPGWRAEEIEIHGIVEADPPLFRIERSLVRPLGLLLRTVQVNVHTPPRSGLKIWCARRAAHKAVDPGMLDSLVSGGIAAEETPMVTLMRESAEEAGIGDALSRLALPTGIMDSTSIDLDYGHPVLHRERMHVFDLQVPEDFRPFHTDGEIEASALLTPEQVVSQVRQGLWTREGAWASINLIHRHHAGHMRNR